MLKSSRKKGVFTKDAEKVCKKSRTSVSRLLSWALAAVWRRAPVSLSPTGVLRAIGGTGGTSLVPAPLLRLLPGHLASTTAAQTSLCPASGHVERSAQRCGL